MGGGLSRGEALGATRGGTHENQTKRGSDRVVIQQVSSQVRRNVFPRGQIAREINIRFVHGEIRIRWHGTAVRARRVRWRGGHAEPEFPPRERTARFGRRFLADLPHGAAALVQCASDVTLAYFGPISRSGRTPAEKLGHFRT